MPWALAVLHATEAPSTLLAPHLCQQSLGSNGTAPPAGVVNIFLSGLKSPVLGASALNVTLASANITGGAAEFVLQPRKHLAAAAAAVQALTGRSTSPAAKLLTGSYQLTAAYSGDALYGPGTGSASLDVAAGSDQAAAA
ncbi:hypothetical protein COCSUDRAFT_61857 [Coccomyxa subellipsoidea C-169]|uniref:Uncharacterized protein n=1 Tax=Coccomyxa subellipsoidea (strain C-169) TaxID=574566 RepID=I0Z1B3_COCSC|nr:hypothetical protein COCSUDRAFT_61857 [Coccomyxa subellipsoidea C-169]EIE24432.1 hypothetical protein COCSUDRAFT_61857 [Coccomyxa subellipsoidea C-169]|eukprot:XP_005648976.1 hypothetical protein COCSUDRAFT_61857 [Coccomyxa subellipsoidea C-169]